LSYVNKIEGEPMGSESLANNIYEFHNLFNRPNQEREDIYFYCE